MTATLTLPYGQADTIPQQPVTVQGIKNAIDATAWAVKQINHDLSVAGFTSNMELECVEVGKQQCLIE